MQPMDQSGGPPCLRSMRRSAAAARSSCQAGKALTRCEASFGYMKLSRRRLSVPRQKVFKARSAASTCAGVAS